MPPLETSSATDYISLLQEINPKALGERIRHARMEKKWSQRELSSDLFTAAYLSNIEIGKTRPTYKNLTALAERLGKSLDYFLRPASGSGVEFDGRQSQLLGLRLSLLQAQTRLEKAADEEAQAVLDEVKASLENLPSADRARYHQLRAEFFNRRNLPGEALGEVEEARQYLEAGYSCELEVLIESEQGAAHLQQGRIMPALAHFESALEAINNRGYADQSVQLLKWGVLARVGDCHRLLNNQEKALEFYQQALDNASQNQLLDPTAQADLHYSLAALYKKEGDFQRAGLYLGQFRQIYQQAANGTRFLDVTHHLARLYVQSEQYPQAEEQLNQTLRLARQVTPHEPRQELEALVGLAHVWQKQGDLTRARPYLEQGLALQENCTSPVNLGQLYRLAGEIWAAAEERQTAEGYFKQALAVLEGTGLAAALGEIYYSYGQRLKEWGELEEAFKLLEQAYQQRELGRAER